VAHRAKVAPALQPTDVYDADYPVDMAKMTPPRVAQKMYMKLWVGAFSALSKLAARA